MKKEDIESKKTERGGYTKAQLAKWGVPWPPPKGWKDKLIQEGHKVTEMGIFDTYGDIQLKAGKPWQNQFNIGDDVTIPDGVYVDDEGLVVISGGKFIAQLDKLYDYWGNELDKYTAQVQ